MTATDSNEKFDHWVILELMGHRRLAGRLTEHEIGGQSFLRLDVPGDSDDTATQFYSGAAVYCITPTTEDIARKIAAGAQPAPVTRWELERGETDFDVEIVEHDADDDEWEDA